MSKESEFTKGYILVERCNKYYVMFRDKNGKQYCRSTKISILNEDNKPGRQYLYAQQAALKIIAEVEAAPEARKKTRFEDLVEAWLKSYEKDCLKQSTLITYKKNVEKHILPYFRNWRPEDITPFDVKEFLTKKAQSGNLQYEGYGLSNSYVSKLRTILMLIMECAVDKRMIAINPARGVSLPKTYNVRPVEERGVITPEQCREMLSLISDKKIMFSRMLPYYYRKSKVVEELYTAVQKILDKISADISAEDLSLFITTTTDFTLHEKDVGLTAITADNETKRARVIARIQGNSVLTKSALYELIDIYDKTGCTITEDFANYTVTILFSGRTGKPYNFNEIQSAVDEVKPAHIRIEYAFEKNTWEDLRLKLNTWGNAMSLTWGDAEDYDGRTWLYVEGENVYLREDGANAYVVFKNGIPYARLL